MKLDAFELHCFLIYAHAFNCLILALSLCDSFALYGGLSLPTGNAR